MLVGAYTGMTIYIKDPAMSLQPSGNAFYFTVDNGATFDAFFDIRQYESYYESEVRYRLTGSKDWVYLGYDSNEPDNKDVEVNTRVLGTTEGCDQEFARLVKIWNEAIIKFFNLSDSSEPLSGMDRLFWLTQNELEFDGKDLKVK